jgi:light-regulated signal transduction histidine kinase (bacteriophytochrome)
LNEICEDSSQTLINQVNQSSLNETLIDDIKALPELEDEEEPLSATEIEEDKIITRIMQVLQQRETSESDQYQSLTYTDGIYLQNINGDQLEQVIDFLYHLDSPGTKPDVVIPQEFSEQLELFETAEYLGLDDLKVRVVNDGIM